MQALGANIVLIPGGYAEAEQAGIAYAQNNNVSWVSPYNDAQVIAGQGTLALEVLSQLPHLSHSTWLTPVGGGGLAAGIITVLASCQPRPRLVGVQSTASPFFHMLFHRGTQAGVAELPSLADGLSGPVEDGAVTIPILRAGLDDLILVNEEEIGQAVAFAWIKYNQRIEGSAAVSLAAVQSGKIVDRPVVLIISGGNIQTEVHEHLVQKYGSNDHS
jgi:threonine dehydratase